MPVTINGTTGIAGVDGSASTPSVQGSDTNTGEFFPAADTIAWTTGGSERMRVDSSGNVGVGTQSPNYRLEIVGGYSSIGAYNVQTLPPSNVGGGASFSWNKSAGSAETNIVNLYNNAGLSFEFLQKTGTSTVNRLYQMSSTYHAFYSNDTQRMLIDSSGRVTKPYQTSFLASCSSGTHTQAANAVLDFNQAIHNVGSNYNTSTYTFTAPVAGMYFFSFQVYQQNGGTNTSFSWKKNGSDYAIWDTAIAYRAASLSGDSTMTSSIILNLAANDTVATGVRNGSNSVQWYGGHSWFMGYLLG